VIKVSCVEKRGDELAHEQVLVDDEIEMQLLRCLPDFTEVNEPACFVSRTTTT
jgi:hypothetical protein